MFVSGITLNCLLDHRYAVKIKYVQNMCTLHKNTTNSNCACPISHTVKTQKISGNSVWSHHYFILIRLGSGEIVLLESKLYLSSKLFKYSYTQMLWFCCDIHPSAPILHISTVDSGLCVNDSSFLENSN